jgi:hypothetical protein
MSQINSVTSVDCHQNIDTTTLFLSQEGQIEPDNSIGRFLADTMASVPRISSDAFDKLFNDSVQVKFYS